MIEIPLRIQSRLNSAQTAKVLGFSEADIPILIQHSLLKPLGNPARNSTKYFSANIIEELGKNDKWLNDATQTVYDYWSGKNSRKGRLQASFVE